MLNSHLQLGRSRLVSKGFGIAASLLLCAAAASADTFTFNTDPFAKLDPTKTGRQILQGEPSINFNPATDSFAFGPSFFKFANNIQFASNTIENLPTTNVNAISLQTINNPANPDAPFLAGQAATLIAGHVTTHGDGVFIYFNSNLRLDRLVYSADLADPTANLAVLARFPNLSGSTGVNALSSFNSANFTATPEPSTLLLMGVAGGLAIFGKARLRAKAKN